MDNNKTYLNLSYKSPHEDLESSLGYNSDGTINIKYTLLTLRNMLLKNVETINKLIDNADNVTNISSTGLNIIEVKVNSVVLKELKEMNVLLDQSDTESDEQNINYFDLSDDNVETNNDRLNMINNLINRNDINYVIDKEYESESEIESCSETDIIDDDKNTKIILNKYRSIITEMHEDTDDDIKHESESENDD